MQGCDKDTELLEMELLQKLNKEQKESERIKKLGNRASHCVCKYCGGSLSLRKMTYAAYDESKIDIYCKNCERIENGVEPLIYKIASYFVDDMQFDHYPELDTSILKRRMNISTVCNILTWGFKHVGLINEDGFTITLDVDEDSFGETTVFTKTELEHLGKE